MDGYQLTHMASMIMEEFSIVFLGHPSNFKVIRDEKSTILILIEQDYRLQLSNPSDLPCLYNEFENHIF